MTRKVSFEPFLLLKFKMMVQFLLIPLIFWVFSFLHFEKKGTIFMKLRKITIMSTNHLNSSQITHFYFTSLSYSSRVKTSVNYLRAFCSTEISLQSSGEEIEAKGQNIPRAWYTITHINHACIKQYSKNA